MSNIDRKYELFREINKINRFLKQVKLVKHITLNSIKLMKIFKVTMLGRTLLKQVGLLGRIPYVD